MAEPKPEAHPSSNNQPSTALSGSTHDETTLVWSKVWDAFTPPPSNSLKGAVVPSFMTFQHRNRRVSLEVHRIPTVRGAKIAANAQEGVDFYEECLVRILVPEKTKAGREARKRAREALKQRLLAAGDATMLGTVMDQEDDETVSVSEFADAGVEDVPEYAGWRSKYRLPLSTVSIKNVHKRAVTVVVQYNVIKHTRHIYFQTEADAKEFVELIETQKEAEERRTNTKIKANLGKNAVQPDKELALLVEIVSGWDLPALDLTSSDPYVVCFLNGIKVHKTDHIAKTLDPIWTIKNGSLFLIKTTVKQLFSGEGLVCELRDFDQFGKSDKMGAVTVPPKDLYESCGERKEYKVMKAQGQAKDYGTGTLAIRIRHASEYDQQFMESWKSDGKANVMGISDALEEGATTKGGKGDIRSMMTRNKKTVKDGDPKYRARPGPDPDRKDATKWLTKLQIEEEVQKETFHWFDVGSGSLGRLFVEVLGCDDLPNLDTGGALGNKTDTFVAVVFEDCMLKTDVIDDCLNPRWLPWSKRGFIFHIMNSSSQLFLGVFDFDPGLDDHDLIGRVAVDVSNMRPATVYTLKYDIYPTAKMSNRKKKGSITVRVRLELDDERKVLLSSLEPPPEIYVNVKNKKDFRVMRYTCQGKYDMDAYNMKVINSYVEELLAYQHALYYLQDAVMHVLLWKGHFPVSFAGKSFKLPLHSVNAFLIGIVLVERPSLLPSFFFASIAWLMLAVMGYRRNAPNPWYYCKSFGDFFQTLVLGYSTSPPASIAPFENAVEAAKFEEWREKRIKEAEEAAALAYEESLKRQEEEMKELEEVGGTDTDISTKQGGGVSFDVFKPFLYPIQQYLGAACGYLRIAKHIIVWNECYISFWITLGSLVLSLACFFVPWPFLIRWSSRIIVWTLFGPWMKLVDIFYVSKLKEETEEEKAKKKAAEDLAHKLRFQSAVSEARVKREKATKLKAFKKVMFGKFITRVPVLKQDRFADVPRPESQAVPYKPDKVGLAELAMKEAGYRRTRIPGQQLVGEMIPALETKSFTDAPAGQPTKHPSMLKRASLAGNLSGKDSTAVAYAKIGSVVVAAAVITWFGVPFLAHSAESVVGMMK